MSCSLRLWRAVPLAIPLGLSSAGVGSQRSAWVAPWRPLLRKRTTSLRLCCLLRSWSRSATPGPWSAPAFESPFWSVSTDPSAPVIVQALTLPFGLPRWGLRLPVTPPFTKRTRLGVGV
jgi:hypothetical protein